MADDAVSPAELRARATKASRIVLALERYAEQSGRAVTAEKVRDMDDDGRVAACRLACRRKDCARAERCLRAPSEQTWQFVVGIVAARQEPE